MEPYRTARLRRRYPAEFIIAFRRDALAVMQRMAATGGDQVELRIGPRRLVQLTHPDLARELLIARHDATMKGRALQISKFVLGEGLLTSEEPLHPRQRKLVLPAFHHHRLHTYADVMVALAAARGAAWHEGQTINLDAEMMRLTLEIAAQTLFSAQVDQDVDAISRALATVMTLFQRVSNPFAKELLKVPLPATLRLKKARARLDAIVYRIIAERRAGGEDRGDLLSMLLAAQDEETGAGMTDRQVRDEVMTLFLAGHETTANALTWAWYLLAQHPDAEAALHAEVDAVLQGRLPGFDDLPRLPYTRQVFSEAMRLYPPAWIVAREATAEVEIGGVAYPRRTTFFVCPYVLHRDPRYWAEPERFRPERFEPEAKATRHKFAYLPFSTGRRGCIGEQFAWAEGVLVLATLAQQWCFRRASEQPVGLFPSITLRPRHPIPMRVMHRHERARGRAA